MSSKCRNFRHGYYDKVGFQAIDEKRSFELLIREKPADLMVRLAHLTSRYKLSSAFRKQLWMLLLKVTDPEEQISLDRQSIRRDTICDIVDALKVMLLIPSATMTISRDKHGGHVVIDNVDCSSQAHPRVLVLVHLFLTKRLKCNVPQQLKQADVINLTSIGMVFAKEFLQAQMLYSFEDTCSLFSNFICIVQTNVASLIEVHDKFIQTLAAEDDRLYQHLVTNGIIQTSKKDGFPSQMFAPLSTWFMSFYCGILHQHFVLRVLDKVISSIVHGTRPFNVLFSVSKALVNHWRDQLLGLQNEEELTKQLLSALSLEESELIVMSALQA